MKNSGALVYVIKRFVEVLEDECRYKCKELESRKDLTLEETVKLHRAEGGLVQLHMVSCLLNVTYSNLKGE